MRRVVRDLKSPGFLPGALLCLASLSGCATNRLPEQTWLAPAVSLPAEIAGVPHYPQELNQCGPAALAELLTWSGASTTPEELSPYLYIPERGGSLQLEMLVQTRVRGRIGYQIPPTSEALQQELAAGHPVLVLQNNGLSWIPVWHYAVVVGAPEDQVLRLRSGPYANHDLPARKFMNTWRRSAYWAMVALPPDELPVSLAPEDVLAAIEAAATVLAPAAVRDALDSAIIRWPTQAGFHFALANLDYTAGMLQRSADGFRSALQLDPVDLAARNNLAWVLSELGELDQAMEQIRIGREVISRVGAEGSDLAVALASTEVTVQCLQAGGTVGVCQGE